MNIFVGISYIVFCILALYSFFYLIGGVKPLVVRDLLKSLAVALCFTPTLVKGTYFAPAIAGLALDVVANGASGLLPNGLIVLAGLAVAIIITLVLRSIKIGRGQPAS